MLRSWWADFASANPRIRYAWQLLLLAGLYYASGQLSFSLAVSHRIVTLVVFAAEGFSLAALILLGPRLWPGVFVGQLVLALCNGLAWPLAAAIATINSLEALLGAHLFKRWEVKADLSRVRDVWGLLLLVGGVLQPLSATFGNLALWAGKVVPTADLGYSWVSWWTGNGLGQMLLLPFLLSFRSPETPAEPDPRFTRLSLLLVFPLAWLLVGGPHAGGVSIAFALTTPILAWMAAIAGVRVVSMAVALLALVALYAARLGQGPFIHDGEVQLVDLNIFLLCASLTALFIAALFSERKRTAAKLEASEQRLRAIFQTEPDSVKVLGPRGELHEINPAGLAMLEAGSLQELGSRSLFSFVTEEHRGAVSELHRRVMDGENAILKFQITGLRGTRRWLRTHAAPMRNAAGQVAMWLGITHDVTEQEEAEILRARLEGQLRESEEKYRTLVADLQTGVLIQSPTSEILLSNAKALELLGISEAQLLGKSSFDPAWNVIHEDGSPFPGPQHPVPQAIATGQPVRKVVMGVYRPLTGDRAWLLVDAFPVFEPAERLRHVVCTFSDITQIKQSMQARNELEGQLRESQKMEAIGTLAGGIAHDLNNALAIILGNVEMARLDTPAHSGAQESLTEIHEAGARARDMVRQILAFSRRQPSERSCLDLAPVLGSAARLLRSTLPARMALEVRCAPDLPPAWANATQIQQVIINLVTNAMQAIGVVSGRIELQLDSIDVDGALAGRIPGLAALQEKHPGRVLRLSVRDTGRGMEPAVRSRIFEPFYTTKPVGEGTGLGLSVVHGIVQGHDGVITVESDAGMGACFTLYLPVAREAQQDAPSHTAGAGGGGVLPSRAGLHVLYVDDEPALVELVKRLLERQGIRVSSFTDPVVALVALREAPAAYDLLLTDYNMPGLSGLHVAREARAIRGDLPVVVISGFVDEALREQAAAAGVREVVPKADTIEVLAATVQRVIEAQAPRGAASGQPR